MSLVIDGTNNRFYSTGDNVGIALGDETFTPDLASAVEFSIGQASTDLNYAGVILADNPIAYWSFEMDDLKVPAADQSGNGNHAHVAYPQYVSIIDGVFPGTKAVRTVTHGQFRVNPIDLAAEWTIETWFIRSSSNRT